MDTSINYTHDIEQRNVWAVVQLIRIGYEQAQGYVEGGISAWKATALPTSSFERIDIDTLYKRWSQRTQMAVIDVRRNKERSRRAEKAFIPQCARPG
ncbi:MAG: hypothetical protein PVS3B3_26230 [Ktedonobacteraceae bacterium]